MARKSYDELMPFSFPLAGLDVRSAMYRQSVRELPRLGYSRTTRWAINVRGKECLTGRWRGGSRPGLVRFVDEPMGG